MTTMKEQREAPPDDTGNVTISQEEKASRWDYLLNMLASPEINDTAVWHLTGQRRAVSMLLGRWEELPKSLVAELKAYKATLDELYLEAADGFASVEGVLNFLPTYMTRSLVGELCQPDTTDDF